MGSQQSSPLLVPLAHFPHVLSSRYTRARPVTLRLEPCFWSHTHPEPLEIRDVSTNLTMFHVPATPTLNDAHTTSKRLLDMYNAPVATVTSHSRTATTTTTIITPSAAHKQHHGHHRHNSHTACTVETTLLDGKSYVSVLATWGRHAMISCEGDWVGPHNMDFWLETSAEEQPDHYTKLNGRVHCARVARIHIDPHDVEIRGTVLLEIAPGVDVALLLLICAAIDSAVSSQLHHERHHHKGVTAKRRSSRMEIAAPSMRRSDAVPVPV